MGGGEGPKWPPHPPEGDGGPLGVVGLLEGGWGGRRAIMGALGGLRAVVGGLRGDVRGMWDCHGVAVGK